MWSMNEMSMSIEFGLKYSAVIFGESLRQYGEEGDPGGV